MPHFNKFFMLAAAALLFIAGAHAQIPYIDSKEVLKKGYEEHNNHNYKKALEYYRQVNESDTNYAAAVYEQVLTLQADSNFSDAKTLALSGLRLLKSNKRDFLLALAATCDYLNQPDSAMALYDSLRRLYPNDHQPVYEEGILCFRKKKYDSAVAYFQQALLINPNYFKAHYILALIYALQGRLTESFIAMETTLLMTSNADQAKQAIVIITNITEGTDESIKLHSEKAEKYSHPLFDEIDDLLLSKLALRDEYKLQISLNDNIFRQSQLVMEKLKYNPADTNFVMQFYVPLLSQLYRDNMFEAYMLELFSGFSFENVNTLAKKRAKDVDEVKGIAFPYFSKIQSTRVLNYKTREGAKEMYHYNPEENRIIIGELKTVGKERLITGNITLLRSDHSLSAKGYFNPGGKKDGWWDYYFTNGKLLSRYFYKNDELRDTSFEYYSNGNLKQLITRDAAGNKKSEYSYDWGGWLSTVRTSRPDKKGEERSYYANGQLESTEFFDDDKTRDGAYTLYHNNGKIKKQITIKDGKPDGAVKNFYRNGQLSENTHYEGGREDGPYEEYYSDGTIKEKGTNVSGKKSGPYEEYANTGKMDEKGICNKGLKEDITRYNSAGAVFCTFRLKNNIPVNIRFVDEDQHVLYEKEDGNGISEYPIYNSAGVKSVDMKINEKGYRHGAVTFYYYTGAKSQEGTYDNGDLEGESKLYYKDGNIKTEEAYAKDKNDGYYRNFYHNGKLNREGWYKDGKMQGLWKYYHVNGKLKNEIYYLNDDCDGNYAYYNINGEITDKYIYQFGKPVGYVCYDTMGNVADSIYFGNGNGRYSFTHFNGAPRQADVEFGIQSGGYDGLCAGTYINGKAEKQEYFRAGLRDSLCVNWYPDGKVRNKGAYSNGEKIGRWEYYDEAGGLLRDENYNSLGELDGKVNLYACGNRHLQYNYHNGSKTGEQVYYGENDRAAFKLVYDDEDLIGYTYEGKDGNMVPIVKLKNGTGKMTAYYSNGKVSGEASFDQNMVLGPLKVYYSNGQVAEERNYTYTDLDGPFKRYNPDGKLVYEVNYKDDEADGVERTYDKDGKLIVTANYYYGDKHGPTVVAGPAGSNASTFYYHYGLLTGASR